MIKNFKALIFILALGFIFSIGFLAKNVYADQGVIGAYPTKFDPSNPKTKSWFIYDLKPGETKEDSITVVNLSDNSVNVKVYPVDATTTVDGAFALLNENQRQDGVGSWVTLEKNLVTIDPRSEVQIPFTITVPKFTTIGDHAGGIVAQQVTQQTNQKQGLALNIVSRVGTRIYETVPGKEVVSLDLSNFQYKIANNHLEFTFTLTNNGNIILNPTGTIDIKDYSGKTVDTIPLNNLGSVFPGKPTNIIKASTKSAPWFGKFTATVTVNYSPIKAVAKSITFFIYIRDWRVMLPVPAIILLIAFFFILRKLLSHAHKIHKAVRKATDVGSEKTEEIKEHVKQKFKNTMDKVSSSILTQPAYAPAYANNVDEMFIARHVKLLVVIVSISIIVLSSLFALILQEFVLLKVQTQASAENPVVTKTQLIPTATEAPTPTNTPVNKAEMKINVLNGSTKVGAAKLVADNLINAGFNVVKIDNSDQLTSQTIIDYPENMADGADQLKEALKPDYTNVSEVATTSSLFTIILGQ